MSTITITNTSRWPTPAIQIIARWVAREAGIVAVEGTAQRPPTTS